MGDFTELVAIAIANADAQAELTASRARIVAAADQARQRFERNLHDGTQQRLVSLALELRTAQAAVPAELTELSAQLDGLVKSATDLLDEVREIARGIHPAILTEGGLEAALRALARRCPVPVHLDMRIPGPLPQHVEASAYYVVAEALTNVAKHSRASTRQWSPSRIDAGSGVLHVAVSDDGVGGADFDHGTASGSRIVRRQWAAESFSRARPGEVPACALSCRPTPLPRGQKCPLTKLIPVSRYGSVAAALRQ